MEASRETEWAYHSSGWLSELLEYLEEHGLDANPAVRRAVKDTINDFRLVYPNEEEWRHTLPEAVRRWAL